MVTGLLLATAVAGLLFAYREHMRGNFHKLKAKLADDRQEAPVPKPGGLEAITLMRARVMSDSMPEFVSATLLPGRGMNVLQITAFVPGKGEVNLMASPAIEEAAAAMTGTDADANGRTSMAMGGAFEAPWADGIWRAPLSGGGHAAAVWRGHAITLPPALVGGAGEASGGLMLGEAANSSGTAALPDGGQANASFDAGDFGSHWPSRTQVTVSVLLSSRSIELTVTAKNAGDVAEPVGVGWHPRFAIQDEDRQQLRLRVPGEMHVETRDRSTGLPTGALLPVAGTAYDFNQPDGAKLGTMDLNDCFVALHQNLLDSGPVAELNDPAENLGLRLTALSSTIKAMRVVAPANGDFISIEPQFNYPDPFGREWPKETDTGIVVLQPGQATQWKVRLELYSLANGKSQL